MNAKSLKGYILAAVAAATYGTNPAFAVPLYAEGMNAVSVLLFRYLLGLPLLVAMIFARGHDLRLRRAEIAPVATLGVLMAASSLTLFGSYNYLNSGVASTLLFVYPVMVAVLMVFFFHERFRATTVVCLALMGAGLLMLMRTGADAGPVSPFGCCLVMLSSLTYAFYLVMINVSKTVRGIPTLKLLFYVLLSGSSLFVFVWAAGTPLTLPPSAAAWLNLGALAFFPTVVSLICTTVAIQCIGSTPTAIFGAFEPVTAVVLSVVVLGQTLTPRELAGGMLIVLAATLVIVGDPVGAVLLRVRKMFPRRA